LLASIVAASMLGTEELAILVILGTSYVVLKAEKASRPRLGEESPRDFDHPLGPAELSQKDFIGLKATGLVHICFLIPSFDVYLFSI
jgi:hypothetical protein